MTQQRREPDPVTTELLDWITNSTERICRSADGLTEAQVRTPAAPSGWTIAGLVGHVRDSTWFWLHHVIAGNPMEFRGDDEWDNDPDLSFPELLARLRDDTARGCAAVARIASGDAPGWWPEGAWGGYRQDTVRGVLVHLLNDNAAHTGHLDLAREAIDGGVWDYAVNGVRRPA
ncbi:mycothiol transferase [Actinocatenispora rupis]|uniref:DinB superfamily protein n=1 Tax=Actinocatenispora rupis TaxID=519421 RepID=A0A8J3NFR8_9ACTN|nr:DUF664 domain-containing protein [Actinocatenispora rupis]GID15622.1 hypothetical protein Aru02nite_65110 [Actinocatenispora rupis]